MSKNAGVLKYASRRDWVRCYGAGCRRERRSLVFTRWAMGAAFAVGLVAGWLLPGSAVAGECGDGLRLEVGIGVHDPSIDGPEYTTRNPLGIVAARYRMGPWALSFEHASSLEGFPRVFDSPNEHGYGSNVLSVRYGWTL